MFGFQQTQFELDFDGDVIMGEPEIYHPQVFLDEDWEMEDLTHVPYNPPAPILPAAPRYIPKLGFAPAFATYPLSHVIPFYDSPRYDTYGWRGSFQWSGLPVPPIAPTNAPVIAPPPPIVNAAPRYVPVLGFAPVVIPLSQVLPSFSPSYDAFGWTGAVHIAPTTPVLPAANTAIPHPQINNNITATIVNIPTPAAPGTPEPVTQNIITTYVSPANTNQSDPSTLVNEDQARVDRIPKAGPSSLPPPPALLFVGAEDGLAKIPAAGMLSALTASAAPDPTAFVFGADAPPPPPVDPYAIPRPAKRVTNKRGNKR